MDAPGKLVKMKTWKKKTDKTSQALINYRPFPKIIPDQ